MSCDNQILTLITTVASLFIATWALVISWLTAKATTKQAEIAEASRKSSIRPHVTAYTRQYPHQDVVYLFIDNVGFGAARNIKACITRGTDFDPVQGSPLRTWKVLQEPVSVLRANERLWTVLFSGVLNNAEKYKGTEVFIEITYSDIEGTEFPPEEFRLDLLPNEGVLFMTKELTINGEVVEVELRPE